MELQSYKIANKLSKTAVFEWDIARDVLEYDEILAQIIQRDLPRNQIREQFLNPRLVHPKNRAEFLEHVNRILNEQFQSESQDFNLDFQIYTKNRAYIWIRMSYQVQIEDGKVKFVTGFFQNIDLSRQEAARMKGMVERDPMTGLYSKVHSNYLVDQLVSDKSGKNSHALLVIDMDNFKQVNDKLGHLIGDAVILDIALSLKRIFKQTDILGHIGGDEFMVLMKNIQNLDSVSDRCIALRNMLRRSYTQNSESVAVSASIGIAIAPQHGSDFKTLFTHADAALYQVKRTSKDSQQIYSETFDTNRNKEQEQNQQNALDYQQLINNPLDYIFHMVFKSKDTSVTVQILLEIFAKYFNLQRAYIFWNVDGIYFPKFIFDCTVGDYQSAAHAHNPEVRRRMWKKYTNTKYGRFTVCNDTNTLSDSARKVFEKRNIKAFLECAVMDGNVFTGGVGFDDCKNSRTWSKAEFEVLNAFADILRRFLFGQMYYELMKKNSLWDL